MIWLIRSAVIHSIISSIYSADYNALNFDPHTLEIKYLEGKHFNYLDLQFCAVACPARNDLAENVEYPNRYLVMQNIVTVYHQQSENQRIKCDEGFELSVTYHLENNNEFVEFGYMVFFEQSKFQKYNVEPSDLRNFSEVSTGDSISKRIGTSLKSYLTIPWKTNKWDFLWVPKIKMSYNFSSRILTSFHYKVRPIIPDQLKVTCHNNELYGTWYNKDEHLDALYKYNNQISIFDKLEIPRERCTQSTVFGECVRKHNLILPYQFQASSPDTISCSNLTTIPLWNEIPDALMYRMEVFLIALAQVIGEDHELIVTSGILKPLTLPSSTDKKLTKIYLDSQERQVPVPSVIYKLIRHKTHKKCDEKEELCWFDIAIVIHNYPEFAPEQRLCPIDSCGAFGWDGIQYSKFVYCCELTSEFAKSVRFPLGKTKNEPLNLKDFPTFDYDLREHKRKDIRNDVEAEFKKLVGEMDEEK